MDPFSVNNIAIKAALAALEDQKFVKNYVNAVKESKAYVSKMINLSRLMFTHLKLILFSSTLEISMNGIIQNYLKRKSKSDVTLTTLYLKGI